MKGSSKRLADKARKELHKLFKELQLTITADLCNQTVNFLDLTFNLKEGSYINHTENPTTTLSLSIATLTTHHQS